MLHFPDFSVYPYKERKKMNEEPLITTFTKLRKSFLRLASRFLPNEEDASDALQDAFCRLWPRRNQIHSSQEAEALAVTTIRNLCIDQVRKEKVPIMELDAERDSTPTESIEESIERQELFQEVEKLIDQQLSPVQRLILRKKEYEDESIEKIAKELDMQQAAVRMQLSRARKIIRECYRNRHNHEE
jgi:RNA polymerase sigma-70 factor (ECF subfamily)